MVEEAIVSNAPIQRLADKISSYFVPIVVLIAAGSALFWYVGIAIRSGTDIAKETGGMVLIKDDVRDVAKPIQLSRKTVRKIKQNLFWAFFYNIILMPIAAGLLIPFFGIGAILNPIYAAVAMALSSITVSLN